MVAEKLNLVEKDYFSCTFKKRDAKYWLKHEKSISKQLKGLPWQFSFDVKFYPLDPTALTQELTRYQVYLQVREDIITGSLPCSFVTTALLGSYACQSQLGDYDPDSHGIGIEYIKKVRFAPTQTEELLDKIAELHRCHRGQLPEEAEMHYLENAKNMVLYGTHMHSAVSCSDHEKVSIGVGAVGLTVFKDRIRLHRFVWAKIIMISYKRNYFIIKIRPNNGESTSSKDLTYKFSLTNLLMAKRLWRLAVEHHTFFRLREPDTRDVKKRFSRIGSKYRYMGRTQYQAQQDYNDPSDVNRLSQGFNRGITGDRFVWDRTLDPSTPGFSIDRSEEVVMEGFRTATLDLKGRKKTGSVPFADTEDEDGGAGRVYFMKTTHPSSSSAGDVFINLPGDRRPSDNEYLLTGDGTYRPGSYENVANAGRTPYPAMAGAGPGYVTPDSSYGAGPPGYNTPGTPQYGIDDLRREHANDQADFALYQNAGYGTGRLDNQYLTTPGTAGMNGQDDHLKQQGSLGVAGGDGQWGSVTTTTVKTTTRKYTASDGTLVTEHRTEKDGVIETHIENRKSVDIDYDKALADAILSVTDVDQNLSVAKIEIQRNE
jgi:erythrocyte membrane protein band 4.1